MWYARSAEFMTRDVIQNFVWLRIVGDTIFTFGALCLGWFVLGLKTGWSLENTTLSFAEEEKGRP